jgi:purine-binding chemotaxis protein CheW
VNNPAGELRRVLRERAAALATPPPVGRTSELVDLVVFRLGDERYAIDAVEVTEAIGIGAVTSLPGLPAFYRGVIIHQGVVYPLVDVRGLLGAPDGADVAAPAGQALLFANSERTIALAADAVEAFLQVEADGIRATRKPGDEAASTPIRGRTGEGIIVLDLYVLLADARLVIDERAHVPDPAGSRD